MANRGGRVRASTSILLPEIAYRSFRQIVYPELQQSPLTSHSLHLQRAKPKQKIIVGGLAHARNGDGCCDSGYTRTMDIQKFQHACLELTKDTVSLVIDPGRWTKDFEVNDHTIGVIITHEHGDHFDKTQLQKILQKNPAVCIYAHVSIIAQLDDFPGKKQAVETGESVTIGPFSVRFTGATHATIHPDYPAVANLGVVVDDGRLYYPGDSFTLPDCEVETLAVPASAPWLKISEAMDFIMAVKPKACFPTHNAILSPEGQQLTDAWLSKAAKSVGALFKSDI